MTDQLAQLRKTVKAKERLAVKAAGVESVLHADIRACSAAGMSYRAIAAEAGVSFQRVAQIVSESKEEK